MTTIAACSDGERVWIGGDSCVTHGDDQLTSVGEPKVWRSGHWVLGACGSVDWCETLRLWRPSEPPARGVTAWLVSEIRKAIPELGLSADAPDDPRGGDDALLGVRGRIYWLSRSRAAWPVRGHVAACGAGGIAARAILEHAADLAPPDRIRAALRTASKITAGTRPPFHVRCESC